MKIPSRTPSASALNEIENGLNHDALTCIEPAGWPVYTFTSATIAKAARMRISAVSSPCCVRADSSMPR